MNKAVFYIFLFLLTGNLYSQEIIGSWTGSLKIQETSLRLVFNVSMKDSVLISTFDSPDQGAFGLPTTRTTYSESDKKLEIIASGLGIFYRGILDNDSIVGTFNQGGIPFPLTFIKTI